MQYDLPLGFTAIGINNNLSKLTVAQQNPEKHYASQRVVETHQFRSRIKDRFGK
jgi:hypothetical protein